MPKHPGGLWSKLEAHDVIALVVLVGCLVLLGLKVGNSTFLGQTMMAILGFYFGRKSNERGE